MEIIERNLYYIKLDYSKLDAHDVHLIEHKRVEQVVKHRNLGYVVKVYESDLKDIIETNIVRLTVWPDGDSYTEICEFPVESIYREMTTIEKI